MRVKKANNILVYYEPIVWNLRTLKGPPGPWGHTLRTSGLKHEILIKYLGRLDTASVISESRNTMMPKIQQ